jgi:pyruvate,water dikinase
MFKRLRDWWDSLDKPPELNPEDIASLRLDFKERYRQFKLLLSANNRALEIMSDIERALQGATPFGMKFIRSTCTRVSTSVFQIITHINALAPNKYAVLFEQFKSIQRQLNPYVHPETREPEGPPVLALADVDASLVDQVGPKMANIAELARKLKIPIPDGFVVTTAAFENFMTAGDMRSEIQRRIQAAEIERADHLLALSADIQQLIIATPLPPALEASILAHYDRVSARRDEPLFMAVRSSAIGEDLAEASFAGQYRSILNVGRDTLISAYKEVVASKYGVPAMAYRFNRGIRDEDVPMSVGCLRMVQATAGGVMYTRNPVDIRDDAVLVHAAWGLPKSVVDGSTPTDRFIVRREDPPRLVERHIPAKERQYVCYPDEGVCRLELTGDKADQPCLTEDQVVALARLGMQMEAYYGRPQDIEWAVDADGAITVLQCRVLQQKPIGAPGTAAADPRWPVALRGGVTAAGGVGSGKVFVVSKDADALRFPDNAVLVTAQALPYWATLLNRAAAVVTEQGSPAGHLANVAREFGVPALFGVDAACSVLKNDQTVTVDAGSAIVYEGRVESILVKDDKPRNLMAGSAVWQLLDKAAELIVPLHLLNPDGQDFKAENCRTFHDITRFCHEKAVHEMFRFGKKHHFPERSSKQLRAQVPMQWWVLNLDDGYKEEVEGHFVELDNIVSLPMLALWAGITAYPWEGPPPLDSKGFMSVMFQSTTNQAFLPTVRSSLSNRNYFMISKNYCSLQSRLGYHFSIVETLVGERVGENYINFNFKGGGADVERRIRRVLLIEEVLALYGFRTTITEDALIARCEQQPLERMLVLLKILGYISIHTRQLDMVMANPNTTEHYRKKIKDEIEKIVSSAARVKEGD